MLRNYACVIDEVEGMAGAGQKEDWTRRGEAQPFVHVLIPCKVGGRGCPPPPSTSKGGAAL
jgi:hypothetical protein